MRIIKLPISIIFLFLISSCTTDSESDLIEVTPDNNIVTYTGTVRNIININCIVCHANTPTNGAPMSLTTYDNVKEAILNRGLIDRISRSQGSLGMMPSGGLRLPQNTINLVIQWKNDGLQE